MDDSNACIGYTFVLFLYIVHVALYKHEQWYELQYNKQIIKHKINKHSSIIIL